MSTAYDRLVLSLTGRKDCQHHTSGASSTRLVGNSLSPGHELDEIAIVSHDDVQSSVSYGTLSMNGPRHIIGEREILIREERREAALLIYPSPVVFRPF